MKYIWHHIKAIINAYDNNTPLSYFLKSYFRASPKLGSRDRKILSAMAYSWYRCSKGIASEGIEFEQKVNACLLLCSRHEKAIQTFLAEDWKGGWNNATYEEAANYLKENGVHFSLPYLLPHAFSLKLSEGITETEWLFSMLQQPDLFIRIRKEKEKIQSLLQDHHIPFDRVTSTCLSMPNGASVDAILPGDAYTVQDASSQETGNYFGPGKNEEWYDCCAGAGGKSLLLKDIEPSVHLTVSDKRQSILHNLQKRFRLYHLPAPNSHLIDVADKKPLTTVLETKQFDGIICDVPCSGSGTWARTPEQLYFFDSDSLLRYSALQKQITVNVAEHLKPGGKLVYITCSVFHEENEEIVQHLAENSHLRLEEMKLLNGLDKKADSMFIAVMRG